MPNDTPPVKQLNLDFLETFDVLVGAKPDQQRFTVHRNIITRRSEFFKAAKSDSWATKRSKPVDLTDHEPGSFDLYLHCVYCNSLPKLDEIIRSEDATGEVQKISSEADPKPRTKHDKAFEALVKLYILAYKVLDRTTASMVFHKIRDFGSSSYGLPSAGAINLAYSSTVEADGLRKLLVHSNVRNAHHLPKGDYPGEFLQSVLRNLREYMKRSRHGSR